MNVLLGLLGAVLLLYLFGRWSRQAGPARTAEVVRRLAVGVLAGGLFVLMVRSGGALLLPLLPLLIPLLIRWQQGLRRPAPAAVGGMGGARGAQSAVETRFLRMSLDHASGQMRGTVLAGRYRGRDLDGLALAQLLELWRECQADARSVAVLEAYLDRLDADWRERLRARHDQEPAVANRPMTREEAYHILGLPPGASREEIKTAHRRLMQRVHPDHGGSTWLAAQINRAKDLLLQD
ncbi:MAG: DnaJ domain-containing protein [Pseudomonadota bacterium]|nr:DnaJ domain-containing protein [Pseudomonadota bacterium]